MDIKRRVIEPIWLTVLKNYNFVALTMGVFKNQMRLDTDERVLAQANVGRI